MSNIPAELRYSEDHEWISTSAPWKIGVSDYAQNALGDLTYVELPSVGDTFEKGQEFGTLESTKSVSPLFMPSPAPSRRSTKRWWMPLKK